jgi:hypothetical protein
MHAGLAANQVFSLNHFDGQLIGTQPPFQAFLSDLPFSCELSTPITFHLQSSSETYFGGSGPM